MQVVIRHEVVDHRRAAGPQHPPHQLLLGRQVGGAEDLLRRLGDGQAVQRPVGTVLGNARERVVLEPALADQLAHLGANLLPGRLIVQALDDARLAAFEHP